MKRFAFLLVSLSIVAPSCVPDKEQDLGKPGALFLWENANVYFLLTDRFLNGDPTNDVQFDRDGATAMLRGFEGGDFRGVEQKIREGYFSDLGVTALWLNPWVEQIHGSTDEGTGLTYGYHGYWARDWTSIDPNFGTESELASLVRAAHERGIRIIMDVVINHTGPVTGKDPVWPVDWVRTGPKCTFEDYETTVHCTLVENLPDILTGSDEPVELPGFLLRKWENEGRLEEELASLDRFFDRTGYPRAPRFYLIKWLTDYIRRYGIDGFRLDTAKHVEESVWGELWKEAVAAFSEWKELHMEEVLDTTGFFMVGEVYNYGISSGRWFDFGDRRVDYFDHSIRSLINFDFKVDAHEPYEVLFSSYSEILHSDLAGHGVLNYISSHDDGDPFDPERKYPLEAITKLLLCPGASQIYYGDETGRSLRIPGATGDASLRGLMNWDEVKSGTERNGFELNGILELAGKLGRFRRDHPSVGAGDHRLISASPYVFTRSFKRGTYKDQVVVGLDLPPGSGKISVGEVFRNGTRLLDYYSGKELLVKKGMVIVPSDQTMVLLAEPNKT